MPRFLTLAFSFNWISQRMASMSSVATLSKSGFTLNYQDRRTLDTGAVRKMKVRYACPVCAIHMWGRPNLRIRCEACNERMV